MKFSKLNEAEDFHISRTLRSSSSTNPIMKLLRNGILTGTSRAIRQFGWPIAEVQYPDPRQKLGFYTPEIIRGVSQQFHNSYDQ